MFLNCFFFFSLFLSLSLTLFIYIYIFPPSFPFSSFRSFIGTSSYHLSRTQERRYVFMAWIVWNDTNRIYFFSFSTVRRCKYNVFFSRVSFPSSHSRMIVRRSIVFFKKAIRLFSLGKLLEFFRSIADYNSMSLLVIRMSSFACVYQRNISIVRDIYHLIIVSK